jgi:serine/threonine protein kinase
MSGLEAPDNSRRMPHEDIEAEVHFILDQHPEEIAERWEKDIEALPLRSQLAFVQRMARRRREILAPKPYESRNLVALDTVPPEVEELFGKHFNEAVHDMSEIGRGYNGRILAFDDEEAYKDTVYKVLIRPPVGKQNDLLSEASYLADMHAAVSNSEESARVPKIHYLATRQNAKIIAMERVPGHSIEEIVKNKIPIPDDFDIDAAERACATLLERLHAAGIAHNDLRTGNIMLDLSARAGASAYVIDAGNAGRLSAGENSGDGSMLANSFAVLRAAQNRLAA